MFYVIFLYDFSQLRRKDTKYLMIIRNRTTKFSGSLMGCPIFLPIN